ncbi:hypothetical protein JOD69_002990 [Methylocaldum sp. RMAD-M]|nr:hypothetical protein [Methylocaldum sp. RMAD-M]
MLRSEKDGQPEEAKWSCLIPFDLYGLRCRSAPRERMGWAGCRYNPADSADSSSRAKPKLSQPRLTCVR